MRMYGREKNNDHALMRNANDVVGSEERLSRSFLLLFPYVCVRSRRGKYEVGFEKRRDRVQGTRNTTRV